MQAGVSDRWRAGEVLFDLYEITGCLGEGVFGCTYSARHRGWQLELAIKVPWPESVATAANRDRCERDAEAWAALDGHPHLASCYYARRWQGLPLLFVEYAAGGSLQAWLRDGRLYQDDPSIALKRLLDISIQVAWGLDFAHERGLLHGRVCPANVLLGDQATVKVSDFGLTHLVRTSAQPADRAALAYSAPEQLEGKPGSPRSDLWGWALLVLELFQGERTWTEGASGAQALANYQSAAPAATRPAMPPALVTLLRACLQRDPNARPYNLREVAAQVVQIYAEATGDRYPRRPPSPLALADTLNNRALALLDLGRAQEAVQLWRQAHRSQPHHPEVTYNYGLWLWRSAQISDGTLVRELEKSRAASPGERYAYLLGLVHLERGDCEAAMEQLAAIAHPAPEVQAALDWARERQPAAPQVLQQSSEGGSAVSAVCFSPDGCCILAGRSDGMLSVWDLPTRQHHTFGGRVKESIRAVAIAAGNHYAISASDRFLQLWSLRTGQCLADFDLHQPWELPLAEPEEELAGLDRGTFFAVGSRPRAPSRPRPAAFAQRPGGTLTPDPAQRLSADGRFCLSKEPAALVLRELATGDVLYLCRPSGAPLEVTPERRYGLSLEGVPQLWDLVSGERRQQFGSPERAAVAIALLPDGRRCLTASADRTIELWSLASGRCQGTLKSTLSDLRALAASPDGRYALIGGRGWQLWSLANGRCLRTFASEQRVEAIAFSPDGRQALLGGEGWQLWSLDLEESTYTAPFCLNRALASEALFSTRDGYEQELDRAQAALQAGEATAAVRALRRARAQPNLDREPRALELWLRLYPLLPREGLRAAWEIATLSGHQGYITSVAISADGQTLLSGGSDNTLRLWTLPHGPEIRVLSGYFRGTVNAVGLSPDGRAALSGSSRGSLKLWDLSSGHCLHTFDSKGGAPAACFSPGGHYALAGGDTGDLKLWEVATGRCLHVFSGHDAPIRAVCFSPDGRCALSGDAGTERQPARLKLWEVASGRLLQEAEVPEGAITAVCFSPDGRYALSGSTDGALQLWATGVGRVLRTLRGHRGPVTSACFTPDGRYALSGSEDNTLRLWEVVTGSCCACLEGHVTAVNAIAIGPDSRYAVSGSNDGSCKVWLLDWELGDSPAETLRDRPATDTASPARPEWQQLLGVSALPPAQHSTGQRTPAPPRSRARPPSASARPAHPWQFLTLLFVLSWAGTAAAVEIFAPGALNAVLLAWGMAIFVASFFFGRQAGNPTVQLGSLFGVLVLAMVAVSAAPEDFSLVGSALFGALAALVGTGAILGLAEPNPVSDLPGIRACRWLKLKFGAPLTTAILLVTTLAGLGLELVLNQGHLHPLVICIGLAIALPGLTLLSQQRRSLRRTQAIQTAAIALLALLTTFKWTLPSSVDLTTPDLCSSLSAAQIYAARGGRVNAWVRWAGQGTPLLNCTLYANQPEIAQLLMERGARADVADNQGITPLHLAVERDYGNLVAALLADGADPNATTLEKVTPLHLAQSGEVADALIAAGAELDSIAATQGTPLHAAVVANRPAVVERLLAAGADANARCRYCAATTPLHAAVQLSRPELVKLLLAAGSEVNARDRQGRTPLDRARQRRDAALIQLLKSHGAQG